MLAFARSLFAQTHDPLFHKHIWQHSLLTAIASHNLCQALGREAAKDDAFIAGLMHDTGKVLLFTHAREAFLAALKFCLENGGSSAEAERRHLGIDHLEVGREAVAQWKLPSRFVDFMGTDLAVPTAGAAGDIVRLSLAAADCLIKGLGIGGQAVEDVAVRVDALIALGLDAALAGRAVEPAFIDALFDSDIYKLCADL
jgi:putative nucleotidyltransferase with HDIG domain